MALARSFILAFFILLLWCQKGCGIRITDLQIDSPMITGENGWLKCDWNSEGDTLYSIKWYWGTKEFYRWSPKADPPMLIFNVSAFVVDSQRSSQGHVFIKNISLRANGVLRCEVSGEGPFFHTDHHEHPLRVIDLPDKRPVISGSRAFYELHQIVTLTCTSPNSKPAAKLAFYINDEKADTSWLVAHSPQQNHRTRLLTASLGINFSLHPRLIRNGKVQVKCTAQIGDLYWDSAFQNIFIAGEVPQRASRKEERSSSATQKITFLKILKGYSGFVIYLLVYGLLI